MKTNPCVLCRGGLFLCLSVVSLGLAGWAGAQEVLHAPLAPAYAEYEARLAERGTVQAGSTTFTMPTEDATLTATYAAAVHYSGGSGTEADPYRIGTKADLLELAGNTDDYDKCFILTADIDLTGEIFTTAVIAPDADGTDTFFQGTGFAGQFDGDGHAIMGLTIDSGQTGGDYLGLFGMLEPDAQVMDVTLEGVSINAPGTGSRNLGSLCGYNHYGTITRCQTTGSITVGPECSRVGGICGESYYGEIKSSCSATRVTVGPEAEYAGGLCGNSSRGAASSRGSISDCYSSGNVVADGGARYLGGLCGSAPLGSVIHCYTIGAVQGGVGSAHVGSLLGSVGTTTEVRSCYAYLFGGPDIGAGELLNVEELRDTASFGGFDFLGDPDDGTDDTWTITPGYCPRLSWQSDDGPLPPSAPTTSLRGTGTPTDPFLIASQADFLELCGNSELPGGCYALTCDVSLADLSFTASPINRAFGGVFDGGGHTIQGLTIDTGGVAGKYVGLFAWASGTIRDLRLEDVQVSADSGSECVGSLCGGCQAAITGCWATGSVTGSGSVGGLLGYSESSTVEDCHAVATVAGNNDAENVGGLCGELAETEIANSHAAGTVHGGYSHVGGFLGNSRDYTVADCCYAVGDVTSGFGAVLVGGFCGESNFSTIRDCYAAGAASGDGSAYSVGGFIAMACWGTIEKCYAVGAVSGARDPYRAGGLCGENWDCSFSYCFWDTESSGQTADNHGTGLTTAEMQTQTTFTAERWDFVGETANGVDDVWAMDGYPTLALLPAPEPKLVVTTGTGSGHHAIGTVIPIVADAAPEGHEFTEWTAEPADCADGLADPSSASTTFTMPDDDVTLAAVYTPYTYTVTFDLGTHGTRVGGGELTQVVAYGTAATAPEIGAATGWRLIGWDVEFGHVTTDLAVTAQYVRVYTLEVAGGSGSGDYAEGSVVPITADGAPDGQEFVSWAVTPDGCAAYLASAWESATTFTMPAEGVALTATYATATPYGGGAGTADDPYRIASKKDLLELAANTDDYDKCFILAADIGLAGETFTTAVIAPDTSDSTSGFQGTAFTGSFDGDGHIVRNLTIDTNGADNDYLGLFGVLGDGASLVGLGVEDLSVVGSSGSDYVGGLCGCNSSGTVSKCYATGTVGGNGTVGGLCGHNSSGTVSECYATGTVSGDDAVGGLCGYNHFGTVSECYATATVAGGHYVGGLCGHNPSGTVSECYATGTVSGNDCVGGLCGYNYSSTVSGCYATGTVSGDDAVGGLCGHSSFRSVSGCYATGTVSGNEYVGGLIGYSARSKASNCYATGSVSGNDYVGGLCGMKSDGIVTRCYSTGSVSGGTTATNVGGFCGAFSGTDCAGCFWDTETSGMASSPGGGTGMTTVEMQTLATFTAAGWDFVGETANGTDDIWRMDGYPALYCFNTATTYTLTVTGGSGDGDYPAGTAVTVTADAAPDGQTFAGWTAEPSEYANNLADTSASPTTFTMPAEAATLTATYAEACTVTFDLGAHGTRTGGGELVQEVVHGTAATAPEFDVADGWIFAGWSADFSEVTGDLAVEALYDAVPVAVDDSYQIARNTALDVTAPGVLGNDWHPEGDALAAATVSGPSHGTLVLNADGSFSYAPATDFVGTDSFTYRAGDGQRESNTATVTVQVVKTGQTIDFASPSAKTYGDAPFGLVATATSGLPVSFSSSDETVAAVSGATVTIVGAGTATITASQAGDGLWDAAPGAEREVTVGRATLTVTPDAGQSKTFGTADPVLTQTSSGAVPGETAAFTGALSRAAGEDVGTYAVLVGSLAPANNAPFLAANYTTSFTPGVTFAVNAKNASTFTVGAVDPFTYDGTAHTPEPAVHDGATLLVKDTDYTLSYANNTNAGMATVAVAGIGNYTGTQDGEFAIQQRTLTVTPTAGQSKTFGAADPAFAYASSGAVPGETPAFTGALSRAAGEDAGTYAIRVGTLAPADNPPFLAANYTLSFTGDVTFAITHWPEVSGNPVQAVWTIYLLSASLDGIPLGADDEIAILDGDTLVGSFALEGTLSGSVDPAEAIKAWSELSDGPGYVAGHTYTFVCWHGATGDEYPLAGIQFGSSRDTDAGDVFPDGDSPCSSVALEFSARHEIALATGFQFVSSPHQPTSPGLLSLTEAMRADGSLSFVRDSNGNTLQKAFGSWVNGIGDWDFTQGYLFRMDAPATLTIAGPAADPQTELSLRTGFQFVPYLPSYDLTARNAFDALIGANPLDFVRDSSANTLQKVFGGWLDGIGTMHQGRGYLVKMNAEATFSYPADSGRARALAAPAARRSARGTRDRHWSDVSGDASQAVWTVFLVDTGNGSIVVGDEVAIFAGGVCVGSLLVETAPAAAVNPACAVKAWQTLADGPGYTASEPYTIKVWKAATAAEATAAVSFPLEEGYEGSTFPTGINPNSAMAMRLDQSIDFADLPGKTYGDAPFALGATATSGLSVSFASSDTSVVSLAEADGAWTATITGAGTATITASQPGDAIWTPAEDVLRILAVAKAVQTIDFTDLPAKSQGEAPFALVAAATSELPVSFATSDAAVVAVAEDGGIWTATIVGPGEATITASQTGDANWEPAPAVGQTLVVQPVLTVVGGTGGGTYASGTSVGVEETLGDGRTFAGWTCVPAEFAAGLADPATGSTDFLMPNANVTLTATDVFDGPAWTVGLTVAGGVAGVPDLRHACRCPRRLGRGTRRGGDGPASLARPCGSGLRRPVAVLFGPAPRARRDGGVPAARQRRSQTDHRVLEPVGSARGQVPEHLRDPAGRHQPDPGGQHGAGPGHYRIARDPGRGDPLLRDPLRGRTGLRPCLRQRLEPGLAAHRAPRPGGGGRAGRRPAKRHRCRTARRSARHHPQRRGLRLAGTELRRLGRNPRLHRLLGPCQRGHSPARPGPARRAGGTGACPWLEHPRPDPGTGRSRRRAHPQVPSGSGTPSACATSPRTIFSPAGATGSTPARTPRSPSRRRIGRAEARQTRHRLSVVGWHQRGKAPCAAPRPLPRSPPKAPLRPMVCGCGLACQGPPGNTTRLSGLFRHLPAASSRSGFVSPPLRLGAVVVRWTRREKARMGRQG